MSENYLINIFTKGRSNLLSFAHRLLQNQQDAEDALQEAFSRLWPSANQLRSSTDAERLAFVAVRNISIDKLRQQSEHPTAEIGAVVDDTLLANDPEADRDRKEQFQIVSRLVCSQLSDQQQRILKMHDMQGFSYGEIAERLGMQETAVRMQLSRARKTIRECYLKCQDK